MSDLADVDSVFRNLSAEEEQRLRAVMHRAVRREARQLGLALQVSDVDDVVGDTYVGLLRRRSVRRPEHLRALVAQAARNALIDSLRRQRALKRGCLATRSLGSALVAEPSDDDQEALLVRDEELHRLLEGWNDVLPPSTCRMLILRFILGYTAEETARILSTTSSAIDASVCRARRRLRSRIAFRRPTAERRTGRPSTQHGVANDTG